MRLGARDASIMKKTLRRLNDAFAAIVRDIESDDLENPENFYIAMNFPRRLYLFMGDRGWYALARKNGLSKKDLYRRPYRFYKRWYGKGCEYQRPIRTKGQKSEQHR